MLQGLFKACAEPLRYSRCLRVICGAKAGKDRFATEEGVALFVAEVDQPCQHLPWAMGDMPWAMGTLKTP